MGETTAYGCIKNANPLNKIIILSTNQIIMHWLRTVKQHISF